jgi:hypothetical protein
MKLLPAGAWLLIAFCLATGMAECADPMDGPVKVTIQVEKTETGEGAPSPVDPMPRVRYGINETMMPGLAALNGEPLTISPAGGHQIFLMIDGQMSFFGQANGKWVSRMVPLGKGQGGQQRHGVTSEWVTNNKIHISQIIEIICSKTPPKGAADGKRHLDVLLMRYIVENKDTVNHTVGIRNTIDIFLIDNDGALFASPTTHKGQIINGHEFKGPKLPEFIQVLQRPNLENPGFVTHFTLKLGTLEPPTRFLCTNLPACFTGGWNVQPQPAGDSAVAIFFDPKVLLPGGKRDMAYAYGIGIASSPEKEGRVNLQFAGAFERGKQFTITAYVDDPVESQSLTLDLPAGLRLVENKATQSVPAPPEGGRSIVLWKIQVEKLGSYALQVRSSNGVVYNTSLTIEESSQPELIYRDAKSDGQNR